MVMIVVKYRCGYCMALYDHKKPIEMCPKRDNKLPHSLGKLYKPTMKPVVLK
jgi:NAD-dependent dihydropyrimidine dehydrogenase PreA subunit